MDNDGIVTNTTVREETCLAGTNDGAKVRFKPIDNDYCDQLVHCVADPNRYKILSMVALTHLGMRQR